jgi:hypothetical protein
VYEEFMSGIAPKLGIAESGVLGRPQMKDDDHGACSSSGSMVVTGSSSVSVGHDNVAGHYDPGGWDDFSDLVTDSTPGGRGEDDTRPVVSDNSSQMWDQFSDLASTVKGDGCERCSRECYDKMTMTDLDDDNCIPLHYIDNLLKDLVS